MANKVINYATRDFQSAYSQIDSDAELKEQPTRFKTMISGVFDVLNNTLNAIANTLFIRTAYSRPHLQDLLNLIDYQMEWKRTSYVDLSFEILSSATVSGPYTVLKNDLVFSTLGTTAKPTIRFEALSDVTFPMSTTTTTVRAYAKTTQPQKNIGTSNGASWQIFDLPDLDILKEYLTLTIGSDTYTLVNTFANSVLTNTHFRIYYRTDGSSYIKLGGIDSQTGKQYGKIPTNGTTIYANYATGGGINTIVGPGTITEYLGTDLNFDSVTNAATSIGGLEEETIDNAKEIAPLQARTAGYMINESTVVALAKQIPGVLEATAVHGGTLAVNVYIIPTGGGLPSSDLKNTVKTTLEDLGPLGDITVDVFDPVYVQTAISMGLKMLTGYSFATVEPYAKLAVMMRMSEIGKYILNIFNQNGLDEAISEINAYWSSYFGSYVFSSSIDGGQVSKIIQNVTPNNLNRDFQPEDLVGAVEGFVNGIDYAKAYIPSSTVSAGDGGIVSPSSIIMAPI